MRLLKRLKYKEKLCTSEELNSIIYTMYSRLVAVMLICGTYLGVSEAFWFSRTTDCIVSQWSEWSQPFGFGMVSRKRIILRYPQNGGDPCPTELEQTKNTGQKPTIKSTAAAMTQAFMVQNRVKYGQSVGQLRDLLIIVDSSGSIGNSSFIKAKAQLARLVGMLCPISDPFQGYQQVALLKYSTDVVEEFDFNDQANTFAVQQGIRQMSYMGSSTCTATAFNYATNNMFTTAKGMRTSVDVKQEVLVLTDGQSNCGGNAVTAALNLQQKANVYSLVIGEQSKTGQDELVQYVSPPLNEHLFAIVDYRDLTMLVDLIKQQLLNVPCAPFDV